MATVHDCGRTDAGNIPASDGGKTRLSAPRIRRFTPILFNIVERRATRPYRTGDAPCGRSYGPEAVAYAAKQIDDVTAAGGR